MAAARSEDVRETGYQIGGAVRRHWGLFLTEGIVLVILGILALLAPATASVAATVFFGWLLLLSGIVAIALSVMITAGVPGAAIWTIGLLTGINLLFTCLSFFVLALLGRRAARNSQPAG